MKKIEIVRSFVILSSIILLVSCAHESKVDLSKSEQSGPIREVAQINQENSLQQVIQLAGQVSSQINQYGQGLSRSQRRDVRQHLQKVTQHLNCPAGDKSNVADFDEDIIIFGKNAKNQPLMQLCGSNLQTVVGDPSSRIGEDPVVGVFGNQIHVYAVGLRNGNENSKIYTTTVYRDFSSNQSVYKSTGWSDTGGIANKVLSVSVRDRRLIIFVQNKEGFCYSKTLNSSWTQTDCRLAQ